MYKLSAQCFKRTIYFLHCFFSSSLWKTSCQFIILPTCVQNKSKHTEKGGVNRDESFPLISDFLFFLRKIFGNKMFLAWSKQLENEGMGTRIGVSSFFISQSLSSMTMYIIFFFTLLSSLFRKLILFLILSWCYIFFCICRLPWILDHDWIFTY
jgi:hypothetical protein